MDKIKLSKIEKKVFRNIANGNGANPPIDMTAAYYGYVVKHLEVLELVKGAYQEGGEVVDVRLSPYGHNYLAENPSLNNPTDWSKVAIIATIVGTIVSTVSALFCYCIVFSTVNH